MLKYLDEQFLYKIIIIIKYNWKSCFFFINRRVINMSLQGNSLLLFNLMFIKWFSRFFMLFSIFEINWFFPLNYAVFSFRDHLLTVTISISLSPAFLCYLLSLLGKTRVCIGVCVCFAVTVRGFLFVSWTDLSSFLSNAGSEM